MCTACGVDPPPPSQSHSVSPVPTLLVSWRTNVARSLSDRGASFGLGAIVSQVSAEAFGDQLGRIVPRLFRYRFDPSAKTRSAMEQLWRSVVGGGVSGGDFSSREKEVCMCVCVYSSVADISVRKGNAESGNNKAQYTPQHLSLALDCHRATVDVAQSRRYLQTSFSGRPFQNIPGRHHRRPLSLA